MITTITACTLSLITGWAIRRKAHDLLDQRNAHKADTAHKKALRAEVKKNRRRESSWQDVCQVCHG